MLNFKFIRAQFRNVWVIILGFGLIFAILVGIGAIFPNFGDQASVTEKGNSSVGGGAASISEWLFGYETLVVFFAFSIIISTNLINKDISKGYIASWLTTSMSRQTIFNSKLFVLISSTLLFNVWIIILEMLIYGLRMGDFSSVVGLLMVGNLSLVMMSLMAVSLPWIIFSIFQRTGLAFGINIGIIGWFALCYILINLSALPNLSGLKYFKYLTLVSLLNSPLKFDSLPDGWQNNKPPWTFMTQIQPLKALDYAWQLPLMLGIGVGCLTGGQYIIQRKDFSF